MKKVVSWFFSCVSLASYTIADTLAGIVPESSRKAKREPFTPIKVQVDIPLEYTYYSGEFIQLGHIDVCDYDRWNDPDCVPAIIAYCNNGWVYAFVKDDYWELAPSNTRFELSAQKKTRSLFKKFPEELEEQGTISLNHIRLSNPNWTLWLSSDDLAKHVQYDILSDLNKTINGAFNGLSTKISSFSSAREIRSSISRIKRDFRARINIPDTTRLTDRSSGETQNETTGATGGKTSQNSKKKSR